MNMDDLEKRVKVLEDAEFKRNLDKGSSSCVGCAVLLVWAVYFSLLGYAFWKMGGDKIYRHEVERLRAVASQEEE